MQNYHKLELLLGVPPLELKTRLVVTSQKHENLNYSGEVFTRSVYKGMLTSPTLNLNEVEHIEFSTGVICIELRNINASIESATILFSDFIAQFDKDVNDQGILSIEEINQCLTMGSSIMRYWCFNAIHEQLPEEADDDGYGILMLYFENQIVLRLINIQNIYKNTITNTKIIR